MKKVTALLLTVMLLIPMFCAGFAEEELPVAEEIPAPVETVEEPQVPEEHADELEPVAESEPVIEEEPAGEPEVVAEEELPEAGETEEIETEEPSETPEQVAYSFAFEFEAEDNVEIDGEDITLSLLVGETFQLQYNVTPGDAAIQWESEDEEIATIDKDGEIETLAAGEVVIRAIVADEFTAEMMLCVEAAAETPQEEIRVILGIEEESLNLRIGETLQIPYAVSPKEALRTIIWTINDEAIATVTETGEVAGLQVGTAILTASADGREYATLPVVILPAWVADEEEESAPRTEEEVAVAVQGKEKVVVGEDGNARIGKDEESIPDWVRTYLSGLELGQDALETYDATKLATPTNLSWGTNYEAKWREVNGAGGYYWVTLYRDDVEIGGYGTVGWDSDASGMLDGGLAEFFSESGAHKFGIIAEGDYDAETGTGSYTDSDEAFSPTVQYTKPTAQLGAPKNLRWTGNTDSRGYEVAFEMPDNASNDGYDLVVYLYNKESDYYSHRYGLLHYEGYNAGETATATLPFDRLDQIGEYVFTVQPVSSRLDTIQNGIESGYSPVFNLTDVVSSSRDTVKDILNRVSNGTITPKDAVQELSNLNATELASAMLVDKDVLAAIAALDAAFMTDYGVTVGINVTADAVPQIVDTSKIDVVGAALNASSDGQALTMNFGKPSKDVVVDDTYYAHAVQFDLDLQGAPNPLVVPVQITMPIPKGITPSRLTILHYYQDGSYDIIYPRLNGDGTATFTVTRFSTFVFAEENELTVDPVWGFIGRLYQNVLGRTPDSGADTWYEGLLNGSETGASAVRGFFLSAEFLAKDISNSDFVTLVYQTCMDRQPDAKEVEYWTAYLDQGISRAAVLNEFVKSVEYGYICESYGITRGEMPLEAADQNIMVTLFVQRLYTIILNRQAERSGVEHWTNYLLNQGGDGKTTAYEFAFSVEFINAGLSDEEFITRMYRALLNREPEAAGMQDWLNEIALNGREGIFVGFADGPEFALVMASYGVK